MAVLNWGDLTKSQEDDETIEEAIARLIAAHNDDEEAHLDTGQSLESHKAAEIIDHLASSVIRDKILDGVITMDKWARDYYICMPALNTTEGWATAGTIAYEVFSRGISTTAVLNNIAYSYAGSDTAISMNYQYDFFGQFVCDFHYKTNQLAYIGFGETDYLSGEGSFIGFRIEDAKIYAVYYHDVTGAVEYELECEDIDIYNNNIFSIKYTATTKKIEWFINGDLITSHVYDDAPDFLDNIFVAELKTLETSKKKLVFSNILYTRPVQT